METATPARRGFLIELSFLVIVFLAELFSPSIVSQISLDESELTSDFGGFI
jgi:hypothetical protein